MTAATEQTRTLVSRAVIWAGLALGTFLTVLAVRNGIRVPRLEVVLSVIATWALLTVLAVVAVELLRRHHRAIGRHAARYGKRGAIATARHARRHGGTALRWLVAKAAPRWENRQHQPLMFRRHSRDPDERGRRSRPGGTSLRTSRTQSESAITINGRNTHGPESDRAPLRPRLPRSHVRRVLAGAVRRTTRSASPPVRQPHHTRPPGPAHRRPCRRQHPVRMGAGGRAGRRLRARIRRSTCSTGWPGRSPAWPAMPRP